MYKNLILNKMKDVIHQSFLFWMVLAVVLTFFSSGVSLAAYLDWYATDPLFTNYASYNPSYNFTTLNFGLTPSFSTLGSNFASSGIVSPATGSNLSLFSSYFSGTWPILSNSWYDSSGMGSFFQNLTTPYLSTPYLSTLFPATWPVLSPSGSGLASVESKPPDLSGKQSKFVSAGATITTSGYQGSYATTGYGLYGGGLYGTTYSYAATPASATYGAYAYSAAPYAYSTAPMDTQITQEIEEADMIKIDGNNLYLLNQYRGLIICDLSQSDQISITGKVALNGQAQDMYIRNERACIIMTSADMISSVGIDPGTGLPYYPSGDYGQASYQQESGSRVAVVDLTDKAHPQLIGSFNLDGTITDSRVVGNILYVVSSEQYPQEEGEFSDQKSLARPRPR